MQPPAQIPLSVWDLLEQLYCASANFRDGDTYSGLTVNEKRAILQDFAKEQAAGSKRWAAIAEDLRVVSLQLGDAAE
jgi:hypothetical protein